MSRDIKHKSNLETKVVVTFSICLEAFSVNKAEEMLKEEVLN